MQLTAETAAGAEIPFELVDTAGGPRGRVPLYCYRPLTGTFICVMHLAGPVDWSAVGSISTAVGVLVALVGVIVTFKKPK